MLRGDTEYSLPSRSPSTPRELQWSTRWAPSSSVSMGMLPKNKENLTQNLHVVCKEALNSSFPLIHSVGNVGIFVLF